MQKNGELRPWIDPGVTDMLGQIIHCLFWALFCALQYIYQHLWPLPNQMPGILPPVVTTKSICRHCQMFPARCFLGGGRGAKSHSLTVPCLDSLQWMLKLVNESLMRNRICTESQYTNYSLQRKKRKTLQWINLMDTILINNRTLFYVTVILLQIFVTILRE